VGIQRQCTSIHFPSPPCLLADVAQDVSAAALFAIAKLSAHPCPPRDLCNAYTYILSPSSPFMRKDDVKGGDDPASYYLSEAAYSALYSRILQVEARIMYALSFDTHVSLPHPLAITYLQALDFLDQPRRAVASRVVEYLNTALLSPQLLYLTHQPHALAVAAIYNAARELGAKMPESPWWEVFDVDREELGFLVVGMRSLEGWVGRQRDELTELGDGMITRKAVEAEMRRRGLRFGNGSAEGEVDEEEAMMRRMDQKAEQMEE
jgi:cyclin L